MSLNHEFLLSALSPTIFIVLQYSFVKSAIDLHKDSNERGLSIIPYLTLLSNCTVWSLYAMMRGDMPVLVANTVGVCVGTACTVTFHACSMHPAPRWTFMVAITVITIGILLALLERTTDEGTLAMLLSISIYGAPLVTLTKVIEEQSTQSMPFLISLGNFISSFCWTLYGLLVAQDPKIVVPSIIGAVLASLQMAMFVIYGFGPPKRSMLLSKDEDQQAIGLMGVRSGKRCVHIPMTILAGEEGEEAKEQDPTAYYQFPGSTPIYF